MRVKVRLFGVQKLVDRMGTGEAEVPQERRRIGPESQKVSL